ncbi:hypothetical protein DERF_000497 [Dermatophagoides farinae]|uniref:Uncharacterized protein n=1 Tax=Dermatophagoides farinae TaxID=6954 RepID=A0A922I7G6_DERFA|nr:hypothetical protein DERF_000497 [Dermatophagoides farinae]
MISIRFDSTEIYISIGYDTIEVSFFGLFVCYAGVQSKLKFYCDPECRQSGTVFINLPFQEITQ